jgi:hypothetical protein
MDQLSRRLHHHTPLAHFERRFFYQLAMGGWRAIQDQDFVLNGERPLGCATAVASAQQLPVSRDQTRQLTGQKRSLPLAPKPAAADSVRPYYVRCRGIRRCRRSTPR